MPEETKKLKETFQSELWRLIEAVDEMIDDLESNDMSINFVHKIGEYALKMPDIYILAKKRDDLIGVIIKVCTKELSYQVAERKR